MPYLPAHMVLDLPASRVHGARVAVAPLLAAASLAGATATSAHGLPPFDMPTIVLTILATVLVSRLGGTDRPYGVLVNGVPIVALLLVPWAAPHRLAAAALAVLAGAVAWARFGVLAVVACAALASVLAFRPPPPPPIVADGAEDLTDERRLHARPVAPGVWQAPLP